jgi:hypothetical protein
MSNIKSRRSNHKAKDEQVLRGHLARKQVLLDKETLSALKRIGGGKLSLGIREAARRLTDSGQLQPFGTAGEDPVCIAADLLDRLGVPTIIWQMEDIANFKPDWDEATCRATLDAIHTRLEDWCSEAGNEFLENHFIAD